jgi:hypothetical protein
VATAVYRREVEDQMTTHLRVLGRRWQILAAFLLVGVAAKSLATSPTETAFMADNETAMKKMMAKMTIRPSGNIDADFVAMMEPHHQGAIDMALAELRYGHNEQLRRIAQEIIIDQQQEIAAMRLALGQPLPPSLPAPTENAGRR